MKWLMESVAQVASGQKLLRVVVILAALALVGAHQLGVEPPGLLLNKLCGS